MDRIDSQQLSDDMLDILEALDQVDPDVVMNKELPWLTKSTDDQPINVSSRTSLDSPLNSPVATVPPSPALTDTLENDDVEFTDLINTQKQDLMWVASELTLTPETTRALISGNMVHLERNGIETHLVVESDDQEIDSTVNDCDLSDLASFAGEDEIVDDSNYGTGVTDDELVGLTVRELNRRLQGISHDIATKLKHKRRTLKNRGYAQNCRSRRMQQRSELEVENNKLHNKLNHALQEMSRLVKERDAYKKQVQQLQHRQTVQNNVDDLPLLTEDDSFSVYFRSST